LSRVFAGGRLAVKCFNGFRKRKVIDAVVETTTICRNIYKKRTRRTRRTRRRRKHGKPTK
jgi:hypothetical protein